MSMGDRYGFNIETVGSKIHVVLGQNGEPEFFFKHFLRIKVLEIVEAARGDLTVAQNVT